MSDTLVIEGCSQTGAVANTIAAGENLPTGLNTVLKIELNGTGATGDGLSLSFGLIGTRQSDAGGSTIKGLAINRFGGNGITLNTLDGGNTVAGSYIGTDV